MNDGSSDDPGTDPTEEKHIAIIKGRVSNHLEWAADERVADGEWHTFTKDFP